MIAPTDDRADNDDQAECDLVPDAAGTPGDDEAEEPPLSTWGTIAEVVRGLLALLLFSIGVLTLYVAGGFFVGVLSWGAPTILALAAAIALARYLSRRSG